MGKVVVELVILLEVLELETPLNIAFNIAHT